MTDQLTLPQGISDLEGTEPVVTGKPDWWTINLIGIAAVAERGVIGARGKFRGTTQKTWTTSKSILLVQAKRL